MTTRTDGNFFEDFKVGQHFDHAEAVPVTPEMIAENASLTGLPLTGQPDSVLVFNLVFGLSVADISLNAVANLGYADGRFGADVAVRDALSVSSEVIGLRQVSSGKAGVVYVTTSAQNQRDEEVLRYTRWVLVNKRDLSLPAPTPVIPPLPKASSSEAVGQQKSGEGRGEGILTIHQGSHPITEADHQAATRLWHNPARLHFDATASPYGRCLVYGGYVIACAWALSGGASRLTALHGGTHHNPAFAGDVIYAATSHHPDGTRTLWARKNAPFTAPPDPQDPDLLLEWVVE